MDQRGEKEIGAQTENTKECGGGKLGDQQGKSKIDCDSWIY